MRNAIKGDVVSNFFARLLRIASHPLFKHYGPAFSLAQVALMLLCWELTAVGNGLIFFLLTAVPFATTAWVGSKLSREDFAFVLVIALPLFTLIVFAVMSLLVSPLDW